jgi:hypothetical protein
MTGLQRLQQLYGLFGPKTILLPIQSGTKKCLREGWQNTTLEATQDPSYQVALANGGIAVLFGPENLAGLDCDTEERVDEFLSLNPLASQTLQTRGARGRTFHFRLRGDYPKLLCKLKTVDGQKIGEWRGADGYTVVSGIHPDTGAPYQILVEKPPLLTDWSYIKWPPHWNVPWQPKTAETGGSKTPDGNLTPRILAYLAGCPAAISGNDGHSQTLKVASQLVIGFGLGVAGAMPYLREYNKKCEPAWSAKELLHKAEEAAKNNLGRESGAKIYGGYSRLSPIDGDNGEIASDFYDVSKKEYLTRNESGRWLSLTDAQFKLRLRQRGIQTRKPDDKMISAGEEVMLRLQDYFDVQYSGALAGKKSGFYEENGIRLLITSDPKLIVAVKGTWPTLNKFLTNLLGGPSEPWADRQLNTFYGWLLTAIQALRLEQFQPGQALTLAGPVNCGKSLLQTIITEVLAGRSAKAAMFLQGRTEFNSELFSAEHLVLEDEAANTSHQARASLGSYIKAMTVNRVHACHGKRRDIVNLCPWWRLSISCNNRPDKLLILPTLSDDVSDKIILLRASVAAMPLPTETSAEKEFFWETLKSELPAFLWWLENNFVIPDALKSSRFGVIEFHHPELLEALDELSPSHALEELIDTAKIWGPVDGYWEGTALELRSVLLSNDRTRRDAEHLLSWTNATGQYLGDLQKKSPDRYQYNKTNQQRIWTIFPCNH